MQPNSHRVEHKFPTHQELALETPQHTYAQPSHSAIFQPIMDLSNGTFLGYEGLIGDTVGSSATLLAFPGKRKNFLKSEMYDQQLIIESFAAQHLAGRLFLNVGLETFLQPDFAITQTLTIIEDLSIDTERIVITIAENTRAFNRDYMFNLLLQYRSSGFQIAITGGHEELFSLQLLSELSPEFIKLDMRFGQGINPDPAIQPLANAIQKIAASAGARVIAVSLPPLLEYQA